MNSSHRERITQAIDLFRELARRDLQERYRGTWGGLIWAFAQPLFLLVLYTVTFGLALGVRATSKADVLSYGAFLFIGLIVHQAVGECLHRGASCVSGRPNLVKKMVFPLGMLPLVVSLTALVHALIALSVWLLFHWIVFGPPPLTALLAPFALVAMLPALAGLSSLFATLGAFFRDTRETATLLSHVLLFATPVFYSREHLPPRFADWLSINPFSGLIEVLRALLLGSPMPCALTLGWTALVFLGLACVGFALFGSARRRFAEVL